VIHGPEVDLFNLPPTNVSTSKGDYQQILPDANVQGNTSLIQFRIRRSNSFIDLNDSFIHVKVKVQKKDGTNLLETEKIAPGNLFLHTLFKNLSVRVNNKAVIGSNGLYAYQAWMQKKLKVSSGVKDSELSKEVYYKDNDPDDYSDANTGFTQRVELAKKSRSFEMIGKISDNFFNQQRYLINTVDVDIELTRNDPKFCLSAATDTRDEYSVEIEQATLYVKRRILDEDLFNNIHQKFSKGKPVVYPFTRTKMDTAVIPAGSMYYINGSLFSGTLPKFVCIGLVTSQAFNGKINKSPFNFKSNNLTKLVFTVNGMPVLYKALECNFKNGEYLLAYNTLFGQDTSKLGNGISLTDYIHGNTLYVYDFGGSTNTSKQLQGESEGTVGIEINFADPLLEHQTLVIMSEFQCVIEIDSNGSVEVVN